jgi:hypothetical protein
MQMKYVYYAYITEIMQSYLNVKNILFLMNHLKVANASSSIFIFV